MHILSPTPTLVPSGQEGGNLVQSSLAALTMTAPGSRPATPLPDPMDHCAPEPNPSTATQRGPLGIVNRIPVADTSGRIRTERPSGSTAWVPTPCGSDDLGRDGRMRGPVRQPDWPAYLMGPDQADGQL